MAEFEDALRSKLERNRQIEEQRAEARREFERRQEEERAAAERREREAVADRETHHAELVGELERLIATLEETSAGEIITRAGWSASGEEFVAEMSTIDMRPARTLFVEIDRDDDEVLARWSSDEGAAVEMWRLLEFDADMLQQLILQLIDQELWRHDAGTPPFPS